jgi:hypothetical protein
LLYSLTVIALTQQCQEVVQLMKVQILDGKCNYITSILLTCSSLQYRWSENIQRSFYNAWKSHHGLKHQTVDNALGFTVDMTSPSSTRDHDVKVLNQSDMNGRLYRLFQRTNSVNYMMFGDSAYQRNTNICSYDIERGTVFNHSMKSVRISVEWNYATTSSMFKILQNKWKLQILNNPNTCRLYTVCVLLKNMHCCLYGNQSSNYFSAILPNDLLELYINQDIR